MASGPLAPAAAPATATATATGTATGTGTATPAAASIRRSKTLTRAMRVFDFDATGRCAPLSLTRMQLLDLVRDAYPVDDDFPTEPGAVQPRDLRIVDPDAFAATAEPVIAVRAFAVLFGLYPVRALMLPGRLLVFAAEGDELAELALAEIKARVVRWSAPATAAAAGADGDEDAESAVDAPLPIELKMLETVVSVVSSQLAAMVDGVVAESLAKIAAALKTPKIAELEKLRQVRTKTDRIKSLVDGVDAAIDALLGNDHDLAALCFTHLLSDPTLLRADRPWESAAAGEDTALAVARRLGRSGNSGADVGDDGGGDGDDRVAETLAERVEMVIELYDLEVQSSAGRVANALNELKATDLEICRELDVARNNLIRIEIIAMTCTTGAVLGSLLTNAFGMNLPNGIEDQDSGFYALTLLAIGGAALFIVGFMWHFLRSHYVL